MSKLSDSKVIKEILVRHGFHFSKSLGQNFLINPTVCPKMAKQCGVRENGGVLEIGPGIGVLTYELAQRAKKVVAVELDSRLLPVLTETLSEFDNISVIQGDILKIDLKELLEKEFGKIPVSVCANLPYYITSPVIMKLLEEQLPIESLTVMVQKEAAERICAQPGMRASGAISAAVRYYAEPEILFFVSKGSFLPSPKVDSAVIRLNILKQPSVSVEEPKQFFAVIKAGFSQRRKTILNSLSAGFSIDKAQMSEILKHCLIPSTARAEQLTLEQFAAISDAITNRNEK